MSVRGSALLTGEEDTVGRPQAQAPEHQATLSGSLPNADTDPRRLL